MKKMNCYIINYNRLTTTRNMVEFLKKEPRINIIIIDNDSTYPPLLEWYNECDVEVRRMEYNYGYKVIWNTKQLFKDGVESERYIITDSDLILDNIKEDWLDKMNYYLDISDAQKVGFSLDIFNIPNENPLKSEIINHESQFWSQPIQDVYVAAVDTTFALYEENSLEHFIFPALRLNKEYMATHQPWQLTKDTITEEDEYFFEHISTEEGDTHWSFLIKNNK